jgi:hypothetical protein
MAALLTAVPGFPASAAVVVAVISRIWFTVGELMPLLLIPLMPNSHVTPAEDPAGTSAQAS